MSQHDKGSSHQLLRVIKQDPKILIDLFMEDLPDAKIRFSNSEKFQPNQSNTTESTIEGFIQGISSEFPHLHLSSLISWWAPVTQKPSWDLISTCCIDGRKGILLVEAKSHYGEMEDGGKTISVDFSKNVNMEEIRPLVKNRFNVNSLKLALTTHELKELMHALAERSLLDEKLLKSCLDKLNHHDKIGNAISEARGALTHFCGKISVSRDNHYQLSNRIAYTWKLASLGIPTILLYLGFTNDPAWISARDHFESTQQWHDAIQGYFAEVGAEDLLRQRIMTLKNGTAMYFSTGALEAR